MGGAAGALDTGPGEVGVSLIGSPSDFQWACSEKKRRCSECGTQGKRMLISVRYGRTQKIVCSEECRQAFDDAFWQSMADKREADRD